MKEPVVLTSLICDDVIRHHDNKSSIIGVFENILSTQFPATHPRMAIYNRWRDGEGEFSIQIKLLDQDKKTILWTSNAHRIKFPDPSHIHNDAWYMVGFTFKNPGTYWIVSYLDDKPVHYEPVYVKLIKPQ